LENGKDLCLVTEVRIQEGGQGSVEVPVLGDHSFAVPGRRDADRVTFMIPLGKWPRVQGYTQHALRDDQGNSRAILITSVGVGGGDAAGISVEAILQP
jgi:hypothetical protein